MNVMLLSRLLRAVTAATFGLSLLFANTVFATPAIVPNGASQDEVDSSTDVALSAACGAPVMDTQQPIINGFYVSADATTGTLTFSVDGIKVKFDGRMDVNLDINQTNMAVNDDTFVLGGTFSASNVTNNGVPVGDGVGSGNVLSGMPNPPGFIFTRRGSASDPKLIEVETLTATANNVGGIFGCTLSLTFFDIKFLRPNETPSDEAGGGGSGRTATGEATAVIQRISVGSTSDGIADSLGWWTRGRASGDDAQANAFGIVPITSGVRAQGVAAGDGYEYPWGMWVKFEHSTFDDDFVTTAFDADRDALLVGADISPYENFVAGVALGYSSTDLDTTFNGGQADFDTFTVVPYMAFLLSDHIGVNYDLSIDMMMGYSSVDIDQFRVSGGTRVSSSTDSDRFFFSSNINSTHAVGDFWFSGTLGWLIARDLIDGFTESNGNVVTDDRVEFGRLRVGGEAAYTYGRFEPFARLAYEYDYELRDLVTATGPQPENDKDQVRLGLGIRFFGDEIWSGGFNYSTIFGRDDFDEDNYSIQVQANF